MKKSMIMAIALISSVMSSAYAACYSSSVDVVFNNAGLSVDIPKLVCVKSLTPTNVSRYSGKVTAQLRVGLESVSTTNRIDSVKYLPNNEMLLTFIILEDSNDRGTCSNGVAYDIRIKARFTGAGTLVAIEEFYGFATSTRDTCHGPFDDTSLEFEQVGYVNY